VEAFGEGPFYVAVYHLETGLLPVGYEVVARLFLNSPLVF
jgi:hypothetical protein